MNHTMNRNLCEKILWLGLTLALCAAPVLRADDAGVPAGQPGRAVRLSYVDGQVRVSQGGQVLADQAVINSPLFEGMQISTTDSGRAEIQFEDGSVARLSPDSSLTLTVLRGEGASGDAEMTLNGGLAYFELQSTAQSGQMNVHFGDATATASGFTVLRVRMDTSPGDVAVFSGNAHVDRGNGAMEADLRGGESATLNPAAPSEYTQTESIEPDSWDTWNSDRDQALNAQAATQTGAVGNISPNESQNPAWGDLDANGNWYDVPGQGYVWSPYDASNPGWDPYGYGNWMYTPGYGYIWASGYPWGYLPYQCGLWNYYDGFGWGWAPGAGGCLPWWGFGFYGGPRFGGFLPGGYRPPVRPITPRGPTGGRPIPILAVNRRLNAPASAFPARDRNTPVTIAGNTVQALRPLTSRPGYTSGAAPNNVKITYGTSAHGQQPGIDVPRPGYTAAPGTNRGLNAPAPAGAPQNRPAPAYNRSSAPSPRPSYSGGPAPSGGGGAPHGGGGGSSHK